MAISISEKQHWKDRIEKKLKQRIHSLKSENPTFFSNAEVEAKALAILELGIGDNLDHAERLKTEIRALETQRDDKNCAVIERLSGEPMLKCHITDYGMANQLELLLTPHVRRKFEELLEKTELGREVARLEAEKDNLMDTIWLATSSRQMSDMWTKVLKLLGEKSTAFQREILDSAKPQE